MESITHPELVSRLVKSGADILASLTPEKCHLDHMQVGVSGEAGELADAIKRHTIYGKDLDRANVIEELGDLLFYMEGICQAIGTNLEHCKQANIEKLRVRYEGLVYSDQSAIERADKQG